jgi:hypothetical protein
MEVVRIVTMIVTFIVFVAPSELAEVVLFLIVGSRKVTSFVTPLYQVP